MAQRIVDVAQEKDLLSLAGNAYLVSLVSELRARSRLFGLTRLPESGELNASALEHMQMLDLIATKDRRGLERLMKAHIGHVRGSWAGRDEHRR